MLSQTHITKLRLDQSLIINHFTTVTKMTVGMISNITPIITRSVTMTHMLRKVTIINRQHTIIEQEIIQTL